ncbi:MAG: hypothetical protein L0Y72_04240 [Gemmataceae bacterium]|nr:hypothetical protein [Gemmataceae bacterium]MCI0738229.1 hypothetical protein [Gemmataceae bacterium]
MDFNNLRALDSWFSDGQNYDHHDAPPTIQPCLRARRDGALKSIEAKYDSLIREKIDEQLRFEPTVETKNRKPLRQPAAFEAQWEIRFGPDNRFRVFTTSTKKKEVCRFWRSVKKTAIVLLSVERS